MALFSFKCSFVTPAKRPCEIIAANESRDVNTAPPTMIAIIAIVLYIIDFSQIIISNAVGDDYLVLEVMFERNAAHHDGGELHVIQCTDAGIRSEILFYNFFCNPADAGG